MKTKLMTIFTRTPLHVGCGSSVGAVDQPVVRERHTRFPIIPGSTIKGVLADLWMQVGVDVNVLEKEKDGVTTKEYIRIKDSAAYQILGNNANGKEDKASAGSLFIGEGKLLAFPVRSAKHCFAWITCPLALKRFAADSFKKWDVSAVDNGKILAPTEIQVKGNAILEEYPLEASGVVPDEIVKALADLSDEPSWRDEVKSRLAIVSDELFSYFAENACEIANHNRIDDVSGVVAKGALFSQENVPSETMFYAVFNSRRDDDFVELEKKLGGEHHLLQFGADMTTGLGWCNVAMKEVK